MAIFKHSREKTNNPASYTPGYSLLKLFSWDTGIFSDLSIHISNGSSSTVSAWTLVQSAEHQHYLPFPLPCGIFCAQLQSMLPKNVQIMPWQR